MTDLRYPIGPAPGSTTLTASQREEGIAQIAATPAAMRAAVDGLTDVQLDTPYRDGGWTARQVVHHVPDSHLNAYVRLKLALTEEAPTIKPYDEVAWAKLDDSRLTPVAVSLALLEALHTRWTIVLRSLAPEDFARPLVHPDHGPKTIDWLVGLYAWHGRHHVAHITSLRERNGW
jgi:hypothetical protein